MNPDEARLVIMTAIASDDKLVDLLVLKGGTALEIIHKIGSRSSLDVDFSIEGDLEDVEEVRTRLFRALGERFDAAGFLVFDQKFGLRPDDRQAGDHWGGYHAEFKLIEKEMFLSLGGDLRAMRMQSVTSGPEQQRKFRIEISAYEFCDGKMEVKVEGYTAYVYTLEMIAVEKLRAICQQSPKYRQRVHPMARARDFYDIFTTVTQGGVEFASPRIRDLVPRIFQAKAVDLSLILEIGTQREFHRQDWPSVQNAVQVQLKEFDYYFDFVVAEATKLEPLWMKDSPGGV